MNHNDYDKTRSYLLQQAENIQTSKRPGYTRGNEDVLANFKNVAKAANCTPEQAWVIYAMKHIDAITTFMTQPHLPVSEAPIGRFADAINYLQLGYALYVERTQSDVARQDQTVPADRPENPDVLPSWEQLTRDVSERPGSGGREPVELRGAAAPLV